MGSYSLPAPTDEEVHEVAARTAKRVVVALAKRGRTLDGLSSVDEGDDQALLVCYDAAARTPKTRLREQVVASARPYVPANATPEANPVQLPLFGKLFEKPDVSHARRKPWAWLLRRMFAVDVMVCPKCAGPMKWREVALTQNAIREGLARAGLAARGSLSLPFPNMRRV